MNHLSADNNRFGWITDAHQASRGLFDVPVLESRQFVVLPSLGSLTVGWLLVVPRRHIPNFTFLDRSERIELEAVVASLLPRLQRLGQVYAFEHGGPYQSLHSCGVDQAHLHLLPLSFDLVDLSSQEEGVSWSEFKPLSWSSEDVEILTEYLWVRSASERGLIGVPSSPQSQWFRKLIARGLNKPDEWDYRKYPALDMINSTSSAFGIVHEHNQRSKE